MCCRTVVDHQRRLAAAWIEVALKHKTFQRHSERHLWATSGKTSLMTCDRSKRLQIIRDVLPDGCRSSETSYRCLDRSGAQTHEPPSGCMQGELCLDGRCGSRQPPTTRVSPHKGLIHYYTSHKGLIHYIDLHKSHEPFFAYVPGL